MSSSINPLPPANRYWLRSPRGLLILIGIAVLVIATISLIGAAADRTNPQPVRIGGGPVGGVWNPLAQGIADHIDPARYDHITTVEAVHSSGGVANMQALIDGDVEAAFLSSSTDIPPGSEVELRVIAMMHLDVLQIVALEAESIQDLVGKRILVGARGNGTEYLLQRVFDHFAEPTIIGDDSWGGDRPWYQPVYGAFPRDGEVNEWSYPATVGENGEPLPVTTDLAVPDQVTPDNAWRPLKGLAGSEHEIAAVAISAGLHAEAIRMSLEDAGEPLGNGQTYEPRIVSFGRSTMAGPSRLDGFTTRYPMVKKKVIPPYTYGAAQPEPIGTFASRVILATRADVPDDVVREFARAIFANRTALIEAHEAAALFGETMPDERPRYPWHDGALAFYNRNAPDWVVRYIDVLNFLLAALLAIGTLFFTMQQWVRNVRKQRIDTYYIELAELVEGVNPRLSYEQLAQFVVDLYKIRRRAYAELVDEKLEAGPSFLIFQQFLNAELENVERLRSLKDPGDPETQPLTFPPPAADPSDKTDPAGDV